MSVIEGKWTCPQCHRTVVIYASEMDTRCCIIACQIRHQKAHAAAAALLSRLGFPPRPKKGRAA